ncbi:MAG: HNH endonuclease [Pyrinomonadaceae bacterium]
MSHDKAEVIQRTCEALEHGDLDEASAILARDYPFTLEPVGGRRYSELEAIRVFVRDGFTDRYSANRLVFPGALRVLSLNVPSALPFQKNWKMTETHPAYWELFPTIDHVVPVARGGPDTEANWVTTSMLRNSAKGNWTLDELGWHLLPPHNLKEWDGLLGWFRRYVERQSQIFKDPYIRRWYEAARKVAV